MKRIDSIINAQFVMRYGHSLIERDIKDFVVVQMFDASNGLTLDDRRQTQLALISEFINLPSTAHLGIYVEDDDPNGRDGGKWFAHHTPIIRTGSMETVIQYPPLALSNPGTVFFWCDLGAEELFLRPNERADLIDDLCKGLHNPNGHRSKIIIVIN